MGMLIVTELVTLDGVAQAPGGPDEDRDRGFTHGGWQALLVDEATHGNLAGDRARSERGGGKGRRPHGWR